MRNLDFLVTHDGPLCSHCSAVGGVTINVRLRAVRPIF